MFKILDPRLITNMMQYNVRNRCDNCMQGTLNWDRACVVEVGVRRSSFQEGQNTRGTLLCIVG
jgi:hypothetical protein